MSETKPDPKAYCAIIFIGGGSSWAYAATPEKAAADAARLCKSDWKHLFKFERKHSFPCNVYDMREHSGWFSNGDGVRDSVTSQPIPLHSTITVTA